MSEITVQHVTRDEILYSKTAEKVEDFNTDINERIDDIKFCIQHGEGRFTLEDEYDLQQWDPAYRDNDPKS